MMKDLRVLSLKFFFFIKAPLKQARQRVCCFIRFILTRIMLKIVTEEFLGLMDLAKASTLCIYKSSEVIMVSKNNGLMFAAL